MATSSFKKIQREDAVKIQQTRTNEYNKNSRAILSHFIEQKLSPASSNSRKLIDEALAASAHDPYGDGDQSPVPDEETLKHINSVAKNRHDAVCMRDDAASDFKAACTAQMRDYESLCLGRPETMFHSSCFTGDIRGVRAMIAGAKRRVAEGEKDALTHLLEYRLATLRMTPLHYCVLGSKGLGGIAGSPEGMMQFEWVADTLLAEGARVDPRDLSGCTPLGLATGMTATVESAKLVDVLLKYGADPSSRLRDGTRIVSGCVATNNTVIFRKLFKAGVNLMCQDSFMLPMIWQSPTLMQVVMEVQREKLVALEVCATCGRSGASKFCSACRKVFYCSKECQKEHWKKHKKVCQASPGEVLEIHVKKMAFSKIDPEVPRWGLVNPVTGICPHRIMRPKEPGVSFIVKMSWVLAMLEMQDGTEEFSLSEPYIGCVKLDEKNGDYMLLKKMGSMKETHLKLRKFLREESGGVGMPYLSAKWKDKQVLQLDLSRTLPPPKTWW